MEYQNDKRGEERLIDSPNNVHNFYWSRCAIRNVDDRCLVIIQTLGYWPPEQLSLNKFFYSIITSMRTSKIQYGRQGPKNGQKGLKRGVPLCFWSLNKLFDRKNPSMRKGCDGEKMKSGRSRKEQ